MSCAVFFFALRKGSILGSRLTFGEPVVPLVKTKVARSLPCIGTGLTDRLPAFARTSLKESTGQAKLSVLLLLASPQSTTTNFSRLWVCTVSNDEELDRPFRIYHFGHGFQVLTVDHQAENLPGFLALAARTFLTLTEDGCGGLIQSEGVLAQG